MISGYPLRYWWLGASATLMIIGSFGPWVRALFVSASGLDGDGWITLIVGVAALVAAFLFARSPLRPRPWWPLAVCIVAAVIGVAVTLNIWLDVESAEELSPASEDDPFDLGTDALVSVGWGLVLTFAASISLAAAAAANLVRSRGALDAPAQSEPSSWQE